MLKKLILTTILTSTLVGILQAQKAYQLKFEIQNIRDSIIYLGGHYGNKTIVVDTALVSKKSSFEFSGDQPIPGGIYFLISQSKKKLFEFIIDKDQNFRIRTDTTDFIGHAMLKASEENSLFFEYVKTTEIFHDSVQDINTKLKEKDLSVDSIKLLRSKLDHINQQVGSLKEEFIENNPEHVLSLIFKTLKRPEIPEEISGNTREARKAQYQYYKSHYWSDIEVSDPRIIRTPVFYEKLNTYFEKVVAQHADSLIIEIDQVITLAYTSSVMFNYLIWFFVEKYDQEEIMGLDKVFLHIADRYFKADDRVETSASVKEQIINRAEKIRPLIIGSPAPNLILLDTNNNFTSFLGIQSEFTIIFFWDHDCGVCKQEVSKLRSIKDTTKIDLQIFAVCTDTNLVQWKKFITEHDLKWVHVNGTRSITQDYHDLYDVYATPLIYVLNREKQIIAKKIAAKQLYPFLKHYIRKYKLN